jgi:hypothetical protein
MRTTRADDDLRRDKASILSEDKMKVCEIQKFGIDD